MGFTVPGAFPYNLYVPDPFERDIDARTLYCAVFGHPIGHSASPAMQNAGIAELGLNWRYLAHDVHPDQLAEAIAGAARMKFVGLNLTVPHKQLAFDLVDVVDDSAKGWGAVNTILFEGRDGGDDWKPLWQIAPDAVVETRSRGFNTDADAIVRSIEEDLGMKVKGASVAQVGVGGAGRAAAIKLAEAGVAELHLINRTESKARELADEIRGRFPDVQIDANLPGGKVDLLLNATSLGLKEGDPLPLATDRFPIANASAVYDMIYQPAETKLVALAREAGCRTANGLGMLLYQGAKALEIWTGRPAPVTTMRSALHSHVYRGSR